MTEGNSASGNLASPPPFSQFASFTSPAPSQSGTPQPSASSAFKAPQPAAAAASDPFAALGAASFTSQKSPPPASSAFQAPAPTSNDDDEWSFSSALPAETPSVPREHRAVVSNAGVKIELLANRAPANPSPLTLTFAFSNNTAQPISELHYQLAVTKVRLPSSTSCLHSLTHHFAGLRARAEPPDRPRTGSQAEPGRHADGGGVLCRRQVEEGAVYQAAFQGIVQARRGSQKRGGRGRRVQHCMKGASGPRRVGLNDCLAGGWLIRRHESGRVCTPASSDPKKLANFHVPSDGAPFFVLFISLEAVTA
jgi:hypothetical protein